MRLTVIGCSGSYPGPDSPASCYLVEQDWTDEHGETRTWRILLDLGNGALGELHNHVDPLSIDAVFLSHLHADHFMDLCGYYVMRKYHPTGAQPQIPVWGPPGTADRLAVSYDLPLGPGMHEEFDFRTYPLGTFEFGPFTVEAVEVVHPVPAYSLRVTAQEKLLVYTGDCGPCEGLDRAADGADLLLAEAAFCDGDENPEDLHLTGVEVAELAQRAGAGHLVLTHIPPWHDRQIALDEAKSIWDGPLDMARTGATYDL
ncbi:ribonuclease BN (tRNA processing enzyme) [Nocardioides daedukensis]|uniref:Ribonuclease BN (tRNA processing enzyme) n=1 Tax=Nocardioides daedukensis TaxID=634462 RepID=A0A7Y9S1B9_9ACTN|nr:MBL fold metallo-hydrolase [Nocardioides daedukensis]NYG58353.1 ribonuclease BN (tRNA processing enzyme) [Nocardioides daedukensis]